MWRIFLPFFLLFSCSAAYGQNFCPHVQSHDKISELVGNFSGVLDPNNQFGQTLNSTGDFNGDGVVDLFEPWQKNYEVVQQFIIFDRWGVPVFQVEEGQSWDGTINGLPADEGIYFYLVDYIRDGVKKSRKGSFTLLR